MSHSHNFDEAFGLPGSHYSNTAQLALTHESRQMSLEDFILSAETYEK